MKTPIQTTGSVLLALSMTAILAACNPATPDTTTVATATPPPVERHYSEPRQRAPAPAPVCSDCGTISGIDQLKAKGTGSGAGAVIGAVAGGLAGHQFGKGHGKDAATVVGAVGGGFAGNEIEKRVKGTTYYHVTVAMQDGSTRSLDVDSMNGMGTGSKVRVVGNSLQVAGS